MSPPIPFFEATPRGLEAHCRERGMPRYLAGQLLDWVYRKGVVDPEAMTNISARNRAEIARAFRFHTGAVAGEQLASDGTRKLLLAWPDAAPVPAPGGDGDGDRPLPLASPPPRRQAECVMIPARGRRTACVSSQVGCPVGCRFCASGLGGLQGNLRPGEIVEQVHRLGAFGRAGRIGNVVFMGMGEPLANLAAVTAAIRTLNAGWGLGISARKITISTVGLPAAIEKLMDFELPVTLALSLHAPNDALRRRLIPWAEYATIDALLAACAGYFHRTGREITLEYLLLRHVNDRADHARELAELARRLRANVNLIRYNEVPGLPFDRPRDAEVLAFQRRLRARGVHTHTRASRGRDIAAACGQLWGRRSGALGEQADLDHGHAP